MVKRRSRNYHEDSHKINRLVFVWFASLVFCRVRGKEGEMEIESHDVGHISIIHVVEVVEAGTCMFMLR